MEIKWIDDREGRQKIVRKKEKIEIVADLIDSYLVREITQDELVNKLMWVVDKPVIKVEDMEYIVTEWEGNAYLESRAIFPDCKKDNWVQVEDLTELKVWEYNELVQKLYKHYPEYPIDYLEGRFVK